MDAYRRAAVHDSYQPGLEQYGFPYPTSFGLDVVQRGQSGACEVSLRTNGDVFEFNVPDVLTPEVVEDIRLAVNSAVRAITEDLEIRWFEFGMHISSALECLPPLVLMNDDDREALQNIQWNVPPRVWSQDAVCGHYAGAQTATRLSINALAEITAIDVDWQCDNDYIQGCTRTVIASALGEVLERRHSLLTERNADPLAFDVKSYRWLRAYLEEYFTHGIVEFDEERLLACMPVGPQSTHHVSTTVEKLLRDAKEGGKSVDLCLMLNGIECPCIDWFAEDELADVVHLYVNETASTGVVPRSPLMVMENVYDNPAYAGTPYLMDDAPDDAHRIFVVHQHPNALTAGKGPLQGIFARMMLDRMLHLSSEKIPQEVLLVDTDAWFLEQHGDPLCNTDILSNGLQHLCAEIRERHVELLGAKTHHTLFSVRGNASVPSIDEPLDPLYRLLDDAHGRNVHILPGGGTLGNFLAIIPLLNVIDHRYPSVINEDAHYTAIAHHAGVPYGTSTSCIVTNEVRPDTPDQMQRWFSGFAGVQELYGAKAFRGITDRFDEDKRRSEEYRRLQEYIQYGKEHPHTVDVRGQAGWVA